MASSCLRLRSASTGLLRLRSARPRCLAPICAAPSMATAAPAHSNLQVVAGLEPAKLWELFAGLSNIPRPSKAEERVLDWLRDFAITRKLEWQQDATGNMVIRRPGTAGGEAAPAVVIQGHVDMVTEKNDDTAHDFHRDPLRLRIEGEWLMASGTTLGADNGIGVCTALALLDMPASVKLPPLECLFTVDEETGLTGAKTISKDLVKGRTMLNLDTEEWGEVCIGCAGGGDTTIEVPVAREAAPPGLLAFTLRLDGLMGGHSGINIHEDRGNAVQLLARTLLALTAAMPGLRLSQVRGGDKRNAIAREAQAQLLVPAEGVSKLQEHVAQQLANIRAEYGQYEAGVGLQLTSVQAGEGATVLVEADAKRLLQLVLALPHGPLKKSHAIAGLVETSNNVASLQASATSADSMTIVTSTRSSLGHALEAVRDTIEATARAFGASSVARTDAYPGWAPNTSSQVLQVTKEAYRELLGGKDAHVGAIHAGLECGLLGEKFEGMDMVSFGPTIRGAHSPDERVLISSVKPFFELTLGVLSKLADKR